MLVFKESILTPVDYQSKLKNIAVFKLNSSVYNLYTLVITVKIQHG